MKRTEFSRLSVPLQRKTSLRAKAGNAGQHRTPAKPKRPRDTGPTAKVRKLVAARSEGVCEWPFCINDATEVHHRLGRKVGGRRGEMADRINQAGWLIHACRDHHRAVTSPVGDARKLAIHMGWLLLEGQDALTVPVMSCHGLVLLDNEGGLTAAPITSTTAEEASDD